MSTTQFDLFAAGPDLPEGLRYQPDIVTHDEERHLISFIETLPLKPFEFAGGFRGSRRVLSFGWRYDYSVQKLTEASAIPQALLDLRSKAAAFVQRPAEGFQQALVTEYAPGAGIGWHKDKPMFGDVVGVSLLVSCRFRLRRREGNSWERASFDAAPRSAYLLSGPARTVWEHSIPPLEQLRYSVTFRNFKADVTAAS
jgi:alkylated DNA repair dioxygenase AlkB